MLESESCMLSLVCSRIRRYVMPSLKSIKYCNLDDSVLHSNKQKLRLITGTSRGETSPSSTLWFPNNTAPPVKLRGPASQAAPRP